MILPLSTTSLAHHIRLFEIIFEITCHASELKHFCCCWYYKRTIDSPEPIRSAMMFGTDWIGPSFKGLGPGLQLLTCWWSNRIIISSKRYYHLKIDIKKSDPYKAFIFCWPNNIWSQKAFTSSTIKRLKTSINSWKKRKLASLERKFIENSGSLALIVDFMELWQSWDSDHLLCWKDGR